MAPEAALEAELMGEQPLFAFVDELGDPNLNNELAGTPDAGLFCADRPAEEEGRTVFPVQMESHSLDSRFLQDFAEFASEQGGRLDAVIPSFLGRAAEEVA